MAMGDGERQGITKIDLVKREERRKVTSCGRSVAVVCQKFGKGIL